MNKRRWIAVLLSLVLFVVSFVIPGIGSVFVEDEETESKSIFAFFDSSNERVLIEGDASSRIVVLDVSGVILDGDLGPFSGGSYNHQGTLEALDQIRDDETIAALVLRVDTPGGGVYESAELAEKINQLKEERGLPVYTVMERMATSGGYYISANTDKIFAKPDTITGSIGVIIQGFNITELLNKLGIEDQTITSGELKDLNSSTRENTQEELEVMQTLVDGMYERFVDTIESGRDLTREQIYQLGDGRIYDGLQAVENGLVDEIGGFDDALVHLTNAYELEDAQVIYVDTVANDFLSEFYLTVDAFLPKEMLPLPDLGQNNASAEFKYIYGGI